MARQLFHFIAGEQHIQFASHTVLDAFFKFQCYARKKPFASEFRELPIEAFDSEGNSLGKRRWAEWHEAVMLDTYGHEWREIAGEFNQAVGWDFFR